MNKFLAQAKPQAQPSSTIQRTIEDESQVVPNDSSSSEVQAGHTVLFGIVAILLLVIAIGAMAMFWQSHSGSKIE